MRPEDLVFIDETGMNLSMVRLYGRALEGQRVYGERPYTRGKNVTLIGALALTGFVAGWTIDGGTNGDANISFIEQILVPNKKARCLCCYGQSKERIKLRKFA